MKRDHEKERIGYDLVSEYGIATVRWFDAVSSTMDEARTLTSEDVLLPAVVGTDSQFGGRGRAGKKWIEPTSGLYVTFIFSTSAPIFYFSGYTVSLGARLATGLQKLIKTPVHLKWPNDLLMKSTDGKSWLKISGILVENGDSISSASSTLLVGVGLNVHGVSSEMLHSGAIGDLAERRLAPLDLLATLTSAVTETFECYEKRAGKDAIPFYKDADNLLVLKGQNIEVDVGDRKVSGMCLGVSASGALELRDSSGNLAQLVSGTVTSWSREL